MLSWRAIAALCEHRDRQAFARRTTVEEWQERGLVFCDPFGGPVDPTHQTAIFESAIKSADLPAIRFHDLRHWAAKLLLSKGVLVKLASEMVGHSTITLTLDT